MSLLNEMLRNLDKRRQLPDVGRENLIANRAPRKRSWPSALIVFSLLLASAAAGAWYLLDEYQAPQVSLSSQTLAVVPPEAPPIADSEISNAHSNFPAEASTLTGEDLSLPDDEPAVELFSATVITPDTAPSITTSRRNLQRDRQIEMEIQQLLQSAEFALTHVRLTSPVEDNAYDRYLRVLDLEPGNSKALSGIDYIVVTYVQLIRGYLDTNNLQRARLLLERAQRVRGAQPSLEALDRQLRSAEEGVRPVLTDTDATRANVRQKFTALKSEEGLLKEVNRLLLNNSTLEARRVLEQFLAAHPDSIVTIKRLFNLYLQVEAIDLAEQLLSKSSHLPITSIELRARLRVQQGDFDGAISLLESATPSYSEAGYYALLAGLYQSIGRFGEAASHYRQLLDSGSDQGTYWLGLAVSLDSLRDYQQALSAFHYARESEQYDGDILAYIEQRIRALSSR